MISTICSDGAGRGKRCRPWRDTVIIGQPFTGRWGNRYWNNDENRWENVHPKSHHRPFGGEWGHDLYASPGTNVYAQGWQAGHGWPALKYIDTIPTCPNGGWTVLLGVYRSGVRVGMVSYSHLKNVPNFAVGQNVRGGPIGKTAQWPWTSCYQVSGPYGVHAHFEARTAGNRFACYWNRKLRSDHRRYSAIGMVGQPSGNVTGVGQGCAGSLIPPGEVRW